MSHPLEALLSPISDDTPCGPYIDDNAELYSEYNSLEQSAQGKPEQVMGESVIPAVEPNWGKVHENSLSLLGKTKDLRVACYLTQSLLSKKAFPGLSDGLNLIHSLLNDRWEDVHPKLIIDDDDDPDYRVNAISYLGSSDFILSVSNIILVSSRAVGSFSLKDYRAAVDGSASSADNKPDFSLINAAFMDVEVEQLQLAKDAISGSIEILQQIIVIFDEKLANADTPQLEPLANDLKNVIKIYDDYLIQRGALVEEGSPGEESAEGESMDQISTKMNAISGEVNSQSDVLNAIEKICKYYEKNEPSSPVPLVLNRAKKLVTMDFMEIMNDMSPDTVHSIKSLAGLNED